MTFPPSDKCDLVPDLVPEKLSLCVSGRLEVCLMGCQDLMESIPGRGRVTGTSGFSDGKSLKARAGLSVRSTNGKTSKADELSCE